MTCRHKPAGWTRQTGVAVQCSVFSSVQCSVFSVQCSVFGVRCSRCSVSGCVFSIQCSVFRCLSALWWLTGDAARGPEPTLPRLPASRLRPPASRLRPRASGLPPPASRAMCGCVLPVWRVRRRRRRRTAAVPAGSAGPTFGSGRPARATPNAARFNSFCCLSVTRASSRCTSACRTVSQSLYANTPGNVRPASVRMPDCDERRTEHLTGGRTFVEPLLLSGCGKLRHVARVVLVDQSLLVGVGLPQQVLGERMLLAQDLLDAPPGRVGRSPTGTSGSRTSGWSNRPGTPRRRSAGLRSARPACWASPVTSGNWCSARNRSCDRLRRIVSPKNSGFQLVLSNEPPAPSRGRSGSHRPASRPYAARSRPPACGSMRAASPISRNLLLSR